MQTQKEEIRENILKVSERLFLKKGYKEVTMRDLAAESGVGLSNLYNYFKNKNQLFLTIVSPAIEAFSKTGEDFPSKEYFYEESYIQELIDVYIEIIEKYRKELKILFFCSSGSSVEDYRNILIDTYQKRGEYYLQQMKYKYTNIEDNVSPYFIRISSMTNIACIEEIVSNDMKEEEIRKFLSDYIRYGTAGWKELMQI